MERAESAIADLLQQCNGDLMLGQPNRNALSLPAAKLAKLEHLRSLSVLWDESLRIPGTKFRVGLESVIGLLPFGGDAIGIVLSCYILFRAIQFGLPQSILLRMALNILIDGVVGTIPLIGDLFDSTWKANTRNVNLLEAHLRHPRSSHSANRRFVILLCAGAVFIVAMLAVVSAIFVKLLLSVIP
jgi:hypothetical protein